MEITVLINSLFGGFWRILKDSAAVSY